jgi:hypothetical protein
MHVNIHKDLDQCLTFAQISSTDLTFSWLGCYIRFIGCSCLENFNLHTTTYDSHFSYSVGSLHKKILHPLSKTQAKTAPKAHKKFQNKQKISP